MCMFLLVWINLHIRKFTTAALVSSATVHLTAYAYTEPKHLNSTWSHKPFTLTHGFLQLPKHLWVRRSTGCAPGSEQLLSSVLEPCKCYSHTRSYYCTAHCTAESITWSFCKTRKLPALHQCSWCIRCICTMHEWVLHANYVRAFYVHNKAILLANRIWTRLVLQIMNPYHAPTKHSVTLHISYTLLHHAL